MPRPGPPYSVRDQRGEPAGLGERVDEVGRVALRSVELAPVGGRVGARKARARPSGSPRARQEPGSPCSPSKDGSAKRAIAARISIVNARDCKVPSALRPTNTRSSRPRTRSSPESIRTISCRRLKLERPTRATHVRTSSWSSINAGRANCACAPTTGKPRNSGPGGSVASRGMPSCRASACEPISIQAKKRG